MDIEYFCKGLKWLVEFPVKAMGSLRKVTAFIALYLRQYLSNDFNIRELLSQDI